VRQYQLEPNMTWSTHYPPCSWCRAVAAWTESQMHKHLQPNKEWQSHCKCLWSIW